MTIQTIAAGWDERSQIVRLEQRKVTKKNVYELQTPDKKYNQAKILLIFTVGSEFGRCHTTNRGVAMAETHDGYCLPSLFFFFKSMAERTT
jgi:hypothetical protein